MEFWRLLSLVKEYFIAQNYDSLYDFVINQTKIELREAFEAADKNGDGILSADEYHDIFQSHGLAIGKRIKSTNNNFLMFFRQVRFNKKLASSSDYGIHVFTLNCLVLFL